MIFYASFVIFRISYLKKRINCQNKCLLTSTAIFDHSPRNLEEESGGLTVIKHIGI